MKLLGILAALLILAAIGVAAFFLEKFVKKKPTKPWRVLLCVILFAVMLVGALSSVTVIKNLLDSKLEVLGEYCDCAEMLLEDKETYTGYLRLEIMPNGSFSVYDGEAGNPHISGTLTRIGKNKLLFICTNLGDFDPPPGWEDMKMIDVIDFEFDSSDNSVNLKFGNSTLKFYKETE